MASGIANNEKEKKKKPISRPADQNENTVVCVARNDRTNATQLDGTGKEIRGCKEQIRNGEYVSIKVTDKPVQIVSKQPEKDDEMDK